MKKIHKKILTLGLVLALCLSVGVQAIDLTNQNMVINGDPLRVYHSAIFQRTSNPEYWFRVEGTMTLADIVMQGPMSREDESLKIYQSMADIEEKRDKSFAAKFSQEEWEEDFGDPEGDGHRYRNDLKKYLENRPTVLGGDNLNIYRFKISADRQSVSNALVHSVPMKYLESKEGQTSCGALGINLTLSDGVYAITAPANFYDASASGVKLYITGSGKTLAIKAGMQDYEMGPQLIASEQGKKIEAAVSATNEMLGQYMVEVNQEAQAQRAADNAAKQAAATAPIKLMIDGKAVKTDAPPVVENGRTLVPVRAFAEAIGCSVVWINETQTIFIADHAGNPYLEMNVNSKYATNYLGDEPRTVLMEVPPRIINGRTMVPARFVAESFFYQVSWNQNTRTVNLSSEN